MNFFQSVAIKIFKMAISYHRGLSNLYDSLGETYLMVGDTLNSVLNYIKSVELNPNNDHGKKMLDRLSEFTNGLTF